MDKITSFICGTDPPHIPRPIDTVSKQMLPSFSLSLSLYIYIYTCVCVNNDSYEIYLYLLTGILQYVSQ